MGKTDIYKNADSVYVTPLLQSTINYGFQTKIDATEGAALGHKPLNESGSAIILFGLDYPKPPKYKRQDDGYSVTSWGDANTQVDLTKWKKIKTARFKQISRAELAQSVYVYVPLPIDNALSYGWRLSKVTYDKIGTARDGLGIKNCETTAAANKKMVWGVNKAFKPPKITKYFIETDDRVTTFYDVNAASIPSGWSPVGGGRGEER